jgi:hypothetical protein
MYSDSAEGLFLSISNPRDVYLRPGLHAHRRCPGANLVESSIWLLMASMLATLDISKPIDESSGKPIEPIVEFDNPIFRFVDSL